MTTTAQAPTPAKRGDAVLIGRKSVCTFLFGSGRDREVSWTYSFAVVTSVTRAGIIKAAERPEHAPWPWRFGGLEKSWVIPRTTVSDPAAMVAELAQDFTTFEEAKAAAQAWRDARS